MEFYKNKKVFLTGHTGFKGTWLCKTLTMLGAEVCGYGLEPPTDPSLYNILNMKEHILSVFGDIRDLKKVNDCMSSFQPDIVIHMAAQPIVRESYINPVTTYEINVMGTVNILEAVRTCQNVKSFLNITTDKVYRNNEWCWGYKETDELNGFDPYSNSKSCSELVTSSYYNSFFQNRDISVSTARAGNVIGGGDFATDRIIPDCVRAVLGREEIVVRNPYSVRPYQHVMEPLFAYLLIIQKQYQNKNFQGNYNIGPNDDGCITTGELVNLFCEYWGNASWKNVYDGGPHEANFLRLDCSKIKEIFKWKPKLNIRQAIIKTVEWSKCYSHCGNLQELMEKQINEYLELQGTI